jgi:hypothetical protein
MLAFKVATVDLSDHVTSFTTKPPSRPTRSNCNGRHSHKLCKGLSADTITVTFLNDTAAGSVLATLQAAYGTTVAFTAFRIRQQQ